jgi:hypothetical protein
MGSFGAGGTGQRFGFRSRNWFIWLGFRRIAERFVILRNGFVR